MKYETLKKYYKPETESEHDALREAHKRAGGYAECSNCKRCRAGCELIYNEYEGFLSRYQ